MNGLLSHALIFKISPINAFVIWEVLNLGYNVGLSSFLGLALEAPIVVQILPLQEAYFLISFFPSFHTSIYF